MSFVKNLQKRVKFFVTCVDIYYVRDKSDSQIYTESEEINDIR